MTDLLVLPTDEVPVELLGAGRVLMDRAFGARFSDEDWDHALGGTHVLLLESGELLAHAAVAPRDLVVGGVPFPTGYVEAVATLPTRQGDGLGSTVMAEISALIRTTYAMGALSTSRHDFYRRLGWEAWLGPTYVRDGDQLIRTPDEDSGIMVLRCGPSAALDLGAAITCEARTGDDW